jgi:hypothetical protein
VSSPSSKNGVGYKEKFAGVVIAHIWHRLLRLRQCSSPIPQRPQVLTVDSCHTKLRIKFNSASQAGLRLFESARRAGVASEVELDDRVVVVQFTSPE